MKLDETTTAAQIEGYHARTRELEAMVSDAATAHVAYPSIMNRVELLGAIDDLNAHMGVVHRHDFAA